MPAYEIYLTIVDKSRPPVPEDIVASKLDLRLTHEPNPQEGWDKTVIELSFDSTSTMVFRHAVRHPQDYSITPENWYYYLEGITNLVISHDGEFLGRNTMENDAMASFSLKVHHVSGCTFIECASQDNTTVILIKPEVRIPTVMEFNVDSALQVFDHDFTIDNNEFIYTRGIDKVHITVPPCDDLPEGRGYYIHCEEDENPVKLFKSWLLEFTSFTLGEIEDTDDEVNDPCRLIGKTIGNFNYLESLDKRIRIVIGYKHITPFDLPVAIINKINESSLEFIEKTFLTHEVIVLLSKAADIFKESGYIPVIKLFVDHSEKLDKYISGEEKIYIP